MSKLQGLRWQGRNVISARPGCVILKNVYRLMHVAVRCVVLMNQLFASSVTAMSGTRAGGSSFATHAKTIFAKTTCSSTRQVANTLTMKPTNVVAAQNSESGPAYDVR